jgi:diguanylate cyclase (GGDEF)-like protein
MLSGEQAVSVTEPQADRILLVEDNDDHAALSEAELADQWRVTVVRTGKEALALLKSGSPYAAVVLDYVLPDMSALEVFQALGPSFGTPIVVISASESVQVAVRAMKAGAADFLVKDNQFPASLRRAIAEAIERGRGRPDARDLDGLSLLYRDYLTGLLNRRRFEELFQQALDSAAATGGSVAVAMLDIDGFKRINDRYGHLAGDRALSAVGSVIRDAVWGSDIAARYGGDEFVLVMPETNLRRAQAVVRRIERRLEKLNESQTLPEPLSLSIGLVADNRAYETLLARADAALYAAKRQGHRRAAFVQVDDACPAGERVSG